MRDLEMKALNDPFLADALEGAESIGANEFSSDVEGLNRKINSNKPSKYIWPLRIAASIALILTVTVIGIQISSNTKTDQLALQQNEMAEEDPASLFSDTIQTAASSGAQDLKQEEESAARNKTFKKPEISQPKTEAKPVIQEPKVMAAEDQLLQSQKLVEADETKDLATDDEKEELVSKSIAEQSLSMEKARSQEQKISPSPTAIAGAGAARKKTAKQDMTAINDVGSDSLYQQYLKANVVYPKVALDNKVEGEVMVSFLVNTEGTLSEFVIEKGIGFGCDEELIRLIKAGPSWPPSAVTKRESVTFVFDLPNK